MNSSRATFSATLIIRCSVDSKSTVVINYDNQAMKYYWTNIENLLCFNLSMGQGKTKFYHKDQFDYKN